MEKKFNNNTKLNNLLLAIEDQLFTMCDTKDESISEIKRYITEFPKVSDFNIAQYGNLLIYYNDIYKFYADNGYKTMSKFSTEKLWNTYKNQVGYVARIIGKTKLI